VHRRGAPRLDEAARAGAVLLVSDDDSLPGPRLHPDDVAGVCAEVRRLGGLTPPAA
jgi:hypothetical protein